MTEQRRKINELKAKIKASQEAVLEAIKEETPTDATEELVKEVKEKRKEKLAAERINIQGFTEELKLVRLNKNLSSAFEWHPHKGMNRRQARAFRRQTRKGSK